MDKAPSEKSNDMEYQSSASERMWDWEGFSEETEENCERTTSQTSSSPSQSASAQKKETTDQSSASERMLDWEGVSEETEENCERTTSQTSSSPSQSASAQKEENTDTVDPDVNMRELVLCRKGLDYESANSESVDLEGVGEEAGGNSEKPKPDLERSTCVNQCGEKVHGQEAFLPKHQTECFSRFAEEFSDFEKKGISWRMYCHWNNSILGKLPTVYETAPFKQYRAGLSAEKHDFEIPERATRPRLVKNNISSDNNDSMSRLAVSVSEIHMNGSQHLKGWFYMLMYPIFN